MDAPPTWQQFVLFIKYIYNMNNNDMVCVSMCVNHYYSMMCVHTQWYVILYSMMVCAYCNVCVIYMHHTVIVLIHSMIQ